MKKTDSVYLEDILGAMKKVDQFLSGMSFVDFEQDDRTQFAVFHALEVIGEAANRLSTDFIEENTDFPIRESVGMRNFIIHGYDQIRLDIVWKTIENDLPKLREKVENILLLIRLKT
ncbi:MAG: DUF86 domain-containing protein [Candidatus Pacebacteria bacterium]|nr:DUF86 domain-containing protein [Candidatus Paceibacterota bacterium]